MSPFRQCPHHPLADLLRHRPRSLGRAPKPIPSGSQAPTDPGKDAGAGGGVSFLFWGGGKFGRNPSFGWEPQKKTKKPQSQFLFIISRGAALFELETCLEQIRLGLSCLLLRVNGTGQRLSHSGSEHVGLCVCLGGYHLQAGGHIPWTQATVFEILVDIIFAIDVVPCSTWAAAFFAFLHSSFA